MISHALAVRKGEIEKDEILIRYDLA